MNRVMTVKETANYLRVNQSTVYRLLKAKREGDPRAIPAFHIGAEWRLTVEDIDAWIEDKMRSGF